MPEHPDYDRVDAFLLKARRSMVGASSGAESRA
jgi:hypothetical protein